MEVNLWQHEPAASLPSGLRKEDILTRITPELCPSSPSHSIHRTYRVNSIFYFIRSELIYSFSCLSVSLYQINGKKLNRSDPIFCGTSQDPREDFWMLKITKSCHQIFIRFRKSTKKSKSANFFIIVLSKRKWWYIEQQLKYQIEFDNLVDTYK